MASAWGARFCFLWQNLEQFRKKKCQWQFVAVELRIEFVFQSDSFIPLSIQLQCGSEAGNWTPPWKRIVIFGWVYFLFPAVRKSWAYYMVNHRHSSQKTPFRSYPATLSGDNSGYFCVPLYSKASFKKSISMKCLFAQMAIFSLILVHITVILVFLTHLYSKTWINANKDLQVLVNLEIFISTAQPAFGNTINKSDSSFT